MKLATGLAATALVVALAPAGASALASPAPGVYVGVLNGGEVELVVKSPTRARLTYTLKSKCAPQSGRLALKLRHGRFFGHAKHKLTVKGRFLAGGAVAKGTIARGGRGACKAKSMRFVAKRFVGSEDTNTLGHSDRGHYAGTNAAGRALSFDLVAGADGDSIENLAVDVDTECWEDYDGDGASDTLLAHISGFGAKLVDAGFDIYYAPDEDTEFAFEGTIADGHVAVDVTVGGHFDADGTPNMSGALECDSWGDTYEAYLQG